MQQHRCRDMALVVVLLLLPPPLLLQCSLKMQGSQVTLGCCHQLLLLPADLRLAAPASRC
jgi:hypothetical protein